MLQFIYNVFFGSLAGIVLTFVLFIFSATSPGTFANDDSAMTAIVLFVSWWKYWVPAIVIFNIVLYLGLADWLSDKVIRFADRIIRRK